jgi:transcriptional repressor NrdR
MVCIYCGGKTRVVNSRPQARKRAIWRRRLCVGCGGLVTTCEQVDLSEALRVKHHSGRLEPFQRDKLFLSVHNSLSHRKTALEDATQLTNTIIAQSLGPNSEGALEISRLRSVALETINHFDRVAGVYYESHYSVIDSD